MEETAETQELTVWVRRHWNDTQYIGRIRLADLGGLHWTSVSGGVGIVSPRPFMHGYVYCDRFIEGEVAHSCRHGQGPHRIKVCVVKKDNEPAIIRQLLATVGARP